MCSLQLSQHYFEAKTSINVNMIYNKPNCSHYRGLNGGYRGRWWKGWLLLNISTCSQRRKVNHAFGISDIFSLPLICLSPSSSVVWIKHNLFRAVILLIIRHHPAQTPDHSGTAAAHTVSERSAAGHTVPHCPEIGFITFYYRHKIKHLKQNACRCSVPQRCDPSRTFERISSHKHSGFWPDVKLPIQKNMLMNKLIELKAGVSK